MNLLESELQYFTPLRNANATTKCQSADFEHFNHEIGCYGNIP